MLFTGPSRKIKVYNMNKVNFLLTGLAAILAAGCTSEKTTTTKTEIPVKVLTVTSGSGVEVRSFVGTVDAAKEANVSCSYPGTLTELKVRQGDKLKKDQAIAMIDAQSVKSMLESAEASQRQAQDAYDRMSKLHSEGVITDIDMVEIETKLAQANASLTAAQRAMDDCTVKAPFACVVGDTFVEEGQDVSPAMTIVKVYDVSYLEIKFSVPEGEMGQVSLGDEASFNVPALGDARYAARVSSKGVMASKLSHSYECTLTPSASVDGLMAGMSCKLWLEGMGGSGVVIPASMVRTDTDGKYVWIVDSQDIVRKLYVQTGGFAGKGVVITEGLKDGDRVITEGMQKVSGGMKVKVIE